MGKMCKMKGLGERQNTAMDEDESLQPFGLLISCDSVVVSTSAWLAIIPGSIPG